MEIAEFCREVETYLCRKNDGHLIRVAGPSFDMVSGWALRGVPLKVACSGIDRYFQRYYRSGPRRRPVKIDFCEADVLDVFDEWRRATGVRSDADGAAAGPAPAVKASLPAHLQRAVLRLTNARASGALGPEFDGLIGSLSTELDAARSRSGGLRGDARVALRGRLDQADVEMLAIGSRTLGPAVVEEIRSEAAADLAAYRNRMTGDEHAHAVTAAVDRLVRERLNLPTLRFA